MDFSPQSFWHQFVADLEDPTPTVYRRDAQFFYNKTSDIENFHYKNRYVTSDRLGYFPVEEGWRLGSCYAALAFPLKGCSTIRTDAVVNMSFSQPNSVAQALRLFLLDVDSERYASFARQSHRSTSLQLFPVYAADTRKLFGYDKKKRTHAGLYLADAPHCPRLGRLVDHTTITSWGKGKIQHGLDLLLEDLVGVVGRFVLVVQCFWLEKKSGPVVIEGTMSATFATYCIFWDLDDGESSETVGRKRSLSVSSVDWDAVDELVEGAVKRQKVQ